MKPFILILTSVLLTLVFANTLLAAAAIDTFSYDWTNAQHVVDTDAPGEPSAKSNNITDAWHGYDAKTNSHYFRMDLLGSISKVTDYGIYIDSKKKGGDISLTDAYTLTGIDYYILSDFGKRWDATEGRWKSAAADFTETKADFIHFQFVSDGMRSSLQWKVSPEGVWDFGTSFYWQAGAAVDSGTGYDVTPKSATPIPGAAWLLGSGLLGLAGLKRRKNLLST